MLDPGAPPPPKRGWSTWSPVGKLFAVFAVLCGATFTICLLAVVGTLIWLYLPGTQAVTTAAISPATTMLAQVHADIDDPGVAKLIGALASEIDAVNRAQITRDLPDGLEFLGHLQDDDARDALEMFWPRDATFAIAGPQEEMTLMLSPRRFGGLLRGIFALIGTSNEHDRDRPRELYREHPLIEGDALQLSNAGGSLLVATTTRAMRSMIDRVEDDAPVSIDPQLWELSQRLAARGDAHAVFLGDSRFLDSSPGTIARSGLSADLLDEDTVSGQLVIHAVRGEEATARAAATKLVSVMTEEARLNGLVLTTTAESAAVSTGTAAEGEIVLDWKVTGIAPVLRGWIAEAMTQETTEQTSGSTPP